MARQDRHLELQGPRSLKVQARIWRAALLVALALGLAGSVLARDVDAQAAPPDNTLRLPLVAAALAPAPGEGVIGEDTAQFVPGQILAGVRLDAVGAAAVLEQAGMTVIDEFSLEGLEGANADTNAGADGELGVRGYVLAVPPGEEQARAVSLAQDPAVVYAEPNWLVNAADAGSKALAAETPVRINDPLYRAQQWYLPRIHASRAWALSGAVAAQALEAERISVVIVDSGVDSTHPDLGRLTLTGRNYLNSTLPPLDDYGHGTHMAGLIGATVNNGKGIASTAGASPAIWMTAFKVLDQNGSGPVSIVAQAIRDASGQGDRVIINLSLELEEQSATLQAAIDYAHSRGALVIAAAGNCVVNRPCPRPVQYPAAYPTVIAVAATGYYDTRAYYSSVGSQIELAAPGGDGVTGLFSTWSRDAVLKCKSSYEPSDGGYCEKSGTSMAAAVTTGVAALTWSLRPELSAEQVRDILTDSARPIAGKADQVGHGLVDAERAARYALRSELSVSPAALIYRLPTGTAPFTAELLLANPSLEPMQWVITGTQQIPWLTPNSPVSGTVRYGQPVRAGLTISPTHVLSGTYNSSFWVEGHRSDGGRVLLPVQANLQVYTPSQAAQIYLPVLASAAHQPSGGLFVDFTWELPDTSGRTPYYLSDNSSIGITLPLTITTGGMTYVDALIYSDGAVVLPAGAAIGAPSSGCLPRVTPSGPVVFGWGADLNPGAAGAQVSGFRAGPDRFVVEYLNVPSAAGQPAYRVSFQIVLYSDGKVGLNYLAAPSAAGAPPHVIAGVQVRDGRFFNQLACVTAAVEAGAVPRAYQSMLFGEGNLF